MNNSSYITTIRITVVLLLIAAIPTVAGVAVAESPTATNNTGIDFGIELQQEATVSQGGNTTIDAYPRNRDDRAVSGTTVELLVDADDDGVFDRTDESVASRTVDFSAEEYRTVSLQYSNVQLNPGNYSYRAILSKDGQTETSFTDGTLTVQQAAGIDFGIELQQEATVAQGGNTTIDAYPRNRDNRAVSGTTVQLLVDADDDGVFNRTGESVASQTVDFNASEYRTVPLKYSNVQLAPGNYSYRAILSKDGQTETSFTDGTLTVEADDDNSDSGLSRFDTDDNGEIGFNEVLAAINAFNNDTQIGGEDVGFNEVIDAIDAFNNDTAV